MADTKLQDLPEEASPAGTDLVYVVVDPGGTPADRKAEIGNLPFDAAGAAAAAAAASVPLTEKGANDGVATLDSAGKIPAAQVPQIAISEFLGYAADQAAMLAFVGERGDWCIRNDEASAWIIINEPSSILANWVELPTPVGGVSSVDGQTGAVDLSGVYATIGALAAAIAALSSVYQPLDSDLTAIAALSTTSFGRGLLILADAATARTTLDVLSGDQSILSAQVFS